MRLACSEISGGYVIRQEDISELANSLRELSDNEEALKSHNVLLEKNYRVKKNIHRLEAQNKLYDTIQKQTAKQIALSAKLLKQFKTEENEETRRKLLSELLVTGAYLKRRNNLIFIGEQNEFVSIKELDFCFKESTDALRLYDIESSYLLNMGGKIFTQTAMELYDFYEETVEALLEGLRAIYVTIREKDDFFILTADVEYQGELKNSNIVFNNFDDGTYRASISVPKGGRAI